MMIKKNRLPEKRSMVKMNLTIDKEFYALLKEQANQDYVMVSTWTKQFLMKNLLNKNNSKISNCLTKDGNSMD